MNAAYLRHALVTAFRAARFEKEAVDDFDHSIDGFFRSFFGAIISLPFFLLIVAAQQRIARDVAASAPDIVPQSLLTGGMRLYFEQVLVYLADWAAFPLAMIGVARLLDAGNRYVAYIIAYNWSACILYALTATAYLFYLARLVSVDGAEILVFAATLYGFAYRWRIAREGLKVSGLNAAGLVLLDVLLGVLVAAAARIRQLL